MDFLIVPGFTAIGYRTRKRLYAWQADRLEGRSVMVTGANAGIGKAISMELCRRGAFVHMVCRSADRGEAARAEISLETGVTPELHVCDLSSQASIREFSASFLASDSALDVLINNAGVLPNERSHTDEGFDDMPAHCKSSLLGSSVTLPVTDGKLGLGTWQGEREGEGKGREGKREREVFLLG